MTEEAGRGTSGKEVKAGTEMGDDPLVHSAWLGWMIVFAFANGFFIFFRWLKMLVCVPF